MSKINCLSKCQPVISTLFSLIDYKNIFVIGFLLLLYFHEVCGMITTKKPSGGHNSIFGQYYVLWLWRSNKINTFWTFSTFKNCQIKAKLFLSEQLGELWFSFCLYVPVSGFQKGTKAILKSQSQILNLPTISRNI